MNKQEFLIKWNHTSPFYKSDLEALIAHEIAKAQEVKLEDAKPQPALNPTEAFEKYKDEHWIKSQHTKQTQSKFDQERFESMFKSVVASGRTNSWEEDFRITEFALEKLDAYYVERNTDYDKQEGGSNE